VNTHTHEYTRGRTHASMQKQCELRTKCRASLDAATRTCIIGYAKSVAQHTILHDAREFDVHEFVSVLLMRQLSNVPCSCVHSGFVFCKHTRRQANKHTLCQYVKHMCVLQTYQYDCMCAHTYLPDHTPFARPSSLPTTPLARLRLHACAIVHT
jgi:hypothetical protein